MASYEPIAVIGCALRFPGDATNTEAFWQMLVEGRSARTKVPADRFNIDAFHHGGPVKRLNTINYTHGHFLRDDVAAFDAQFFSLSPEEAKCLDPMQRLLLEVTYQSLENAGISMATAHGSSTSVHVGSFTQDYAGQFYKDPQLLGKYTSTGVPASMLANRLSWFFNLRGPSLAVDTGCSASMHALHLACRAIHAGEADMGVVAGCNLVLGPETCSGMSDLGFNSSDGICYSFDHRANGYSRGEGIGAVIIKTVSKALADGDTIRAVIRATGLNQDGRTPGITQPSSDAQEALIRSCYAAAGLDLQETALVEAHGTGTALGDPLEASAIARAFSEPRKHGGPLYIGAVKSNVGHLEGASGIAGLIKGVLALENGVIPPNIWFEKLNPSIDAASLNIKFPTSLTPWPTTGVRRVSINSFGFGGANAHAVLDDAYSFLQARSLEGKHRTRILKNVGGLRKFAPRVPAPQVSQSLPRPQLLVLSAFNQSSLKSQLEVYDGFLRQRQLTPAYLQDLGYTLHRNRTKFPWRTCLVATTTKLQSIKDLQCSNATAYKPCFVFTGQGAQWFAMGRELMPYPVFHESLLKSERTFKHFGCQWSLMDELLRAEPDSQLSNPLYSQPVCTALQIALIELLRSWNITPSVVVGHSSGEIAAAYCAGGLSRYSACKVAYHRGIVSASLRTSSTTMMAISSTEAGLHEYLAEAGLARADISIACFNSPTSLTLSGSTLDITAFEQFLKAKGIFARKLNVGVAYHSHHMLQVANDYRARLSDLQPGTPSETIMYSSVTGSKISLQKTADRGYWVDNMVSPVRFTQALTEILSAGKTSEKTWKQEKGQQPITHLIELGPHSALQGPILDIVKSVAPTKTPDYLSMLVRKQSAAVTAVQAAARLYIHGAEVDVAAVNETESSKPTMLIDLPTYTFDHSKSYWLEGRQSKAFKHRKHAHHELLGLPSSDWNPLRPRWTTFLSLTTSPWVADHKVNGDVLYPGSGMLVMALEACRQILPVDRKATGFRFHGVRFRKALRIPASEQGIEVEMQLVPEKSTGGHTVSASFALYAHEDDEVVEICTGEVEAQLETPSAISSDREALANARREQATVVTDALASFSSGLESSKLYNYLDRCGLNFGPCFQSLEHAKVLKEGVATASTRLERWRDHVEDQRIQSHVIHPVALDAIFQLGFVALSDGAKKNIPTMVPALLTDLWISADLCTSPPASLMAYSSAAFMRPTRGRISMNVINPQTHALMIVGQLEAASTGDEPQQEALGIRYHEMVWKPDIDFVSDVYLEDQCAPLPDPAMYLPKEKHQYIRAALRELLLRHPIDTVPARSSHQIKYMRWAESQVHGYPPASATAELRERIRVNDPEGALIVHAADHLDAIFGGSADALEVLFKDTYAEDYYAFGTEAQAAATDFARYVDLLGHKNHALKILEVGAGTGGITQGILRTLSADRSHRFESYTYTDISPRFFEAAREKFELYQSRMKFSTLDVTGDLEAQGYQLEDYDLVIASNVLHATPDIGLTLQNVRRLLKPGGRLIAHEITAVHEGGCHLESAFMWGLVPGWWLSAEAFRPNGPLMSRDTWDSVLRFNGFEGINVALPRVDSLPTSIFVAKAAATPKMIDTPPQKKAYILVAEEALSPGSPLPPTPSSCAYSETSLSTQSSLEDLRHSDISLASSQSSLEDLPATVRQETTFRSPMFMPSPTLEQPACFIKTETRPPQCVIAQSLQQILRTELDLVCEVVSPNKLPRSSDLCISLLGLDSTYLSHIDEPSFHAVKAAILSSKTFIWVTQEDMENPTASLSSGLLRTIRHENSEKQIINLEVEPTSSASTILRSIADVASAKHYEPEYRSIQGLLHVNRLAQDEGLIKDVTDLAVDQTEPVKCTLGDVAHRKLKVVAGCPGALDSLQFVHDETFDQPLQPTELEIQVKASSLNFRDVLTAMGGDAATPFFGMECAGIVARVGSACKDFSVGDRVVALPFGSLKTHVRCGSHAAARIPVNVSFEEAAAFPIVFLSAYHSIMTVAQMKQGESILIHSGAGGFGQACIQIASLLNGEIYATVGTEEKKRFLMSTYGIPAERIFSSRDTSFAGAIKQQTSGRGVDVVVNTLANDGLRASWECIAQFGRFIEAGKKDILDLAKLSMEPFSRSATFAAVDLLQIIEFRHDLFRSTLKSIMQLWLGGKVFVPAPLQVYPASKLETAFRFLEHGKGMGKNVITLNPEDEVMVVPSTKSTLRFSPDATYLIAGGLGGLGKDISSWMASRGARNLILLTSSSVPKPGQAAFVASLQRQGVQVATPICNVASQDSLDNALLQCRHMPPIKGCIQAAMHLRDSTFANMQYDEYRGALSPKVDGSWNLHTMLPEGLDFFIMLSSAAGIIGAAGQSNYAAGNTYQDALAVYRQSLGEKAVSLDLGSILGAGYVAEREAIAETLNSGLYRPCGTHELHSLLEHFCNTTIDDSRSQVILGMQPVQVIRQSGIKDLPPWIDLPAFQALHQATTADTRTSDTANALDCKALIERAASVQAVGDIIVEELQAKLARTLAMEKEAIDPARAIHTYGVDSLSAVEIRTWLLRNAGVDVSVFRILGNESMMALAESVAPSSQFWAGGAE